LEKAGPSTPDSPQPLLYLGSDQQGPFEVDANVLATGRTCVIGASGSGKSYAVSVICEELCKNQVPFAIVDTEGEHSGLREKYDVVVVGDDPDSDLQWGSVDLADLASQAPDMAPLVLDLSETEDPKTKVSELLSGIYNEVEKRRTPYLLIVEEADRFVPQNGDRLPIFGEIARRGRKRGVGLMVCTQRPSLVDKNILSQCGNQLIGKLVIRNDLQAVAQFFSGHDLPKQLTTMEAGRFFVMGGLASPPRSIKIRKKDTRYGGTTPKLGARVIKPFASRSVAALKRPPNPGQGAPPALLGINPAFNPEDIPTIVKRDKSFIFFGKEETVANAPLVFRPLVEVGVAVKTGVLKRRLELRYLVLDGETGKSVEIGDSLTTHEGLQRLIGLQSSEIEVLLTAKEDREMSVLELANKIGVSKEMLRKPVKVLEERRLIRSFTLGKTKVYRRVFSLPELPWHGFEQALEPVTSVASKVEPFKLDEENIREVIKGLIPYSDVQSFKKFVYPLFRVELIMKRKKRIAWLDGRTGKEFRP